MHYFGPWDDPDGALARYQEQAEALHSGRKQRQVSDGLTVKELCNAFLNAKKALVESGELAPRSFDDYHAVCQLLVEHFARGRLVVDLDPEDFAQLRAKLARRWGPVTLGNTINRARVVFKFASDNGMIGRPVVYGQSFARPTKKVLRVHRAGQGAKLFTADEIRRLLDAAGPQLRAMILLGINCGFGNADCGRLPLAALDLDAAMIDFPRPKTGIARRCPLWPETVQALREVLAHRPTPKDPAGAALVFVTRYGQGWFKDTRTNPVSAELGKLLRALRINGRKGLGFYTLRHTFRTVADEAKDQPAADYIMGYEVAHMSSVYRERIGDDRLRAVSDHVHAWLFGAPAPAAADGPVR
jgi:integrase